MVSKPPVMEYHKSFGGPGNWNLERSVAEEVQQKIERLNLPLALNHLTSGNGSCLMIAIQQCLQHEDVIPHISQEVLMNARSYKLAQKFCIPICTEFTTPKSAEDERLLYEN